MRDRRRAVVTGLGLVTPLGLSLEENWTKALLGKSGITRLCLPGANSSPIQAVGNITQQDWTRIREKFPEEAQRDGERRTLFALAAVDSAFQDAGLSEGPPIPNRVGISWAAGLGVNRLEDIKRWSSPRGQFDVVRFGREYPMVHPGSILRNPSDRAAAVCAHRFNLRGHNTTVTSACASATQAIGLGARCIQRGAEEVMVAGGADSMINPLGLVYFLLLQAASLHDKTPETACRPFDRKRSGLVIGEGAGAVILEEESHAVRRGARIYAEIAGYGSSLDAYQVTAPHPEGTGAAESMRKALQDAELSPDRIDYINAHGTGTKLNDVMETVAIKKVFRDKAQHIPISSTKSLIGHLMAAAGAPEFIFTVLSVQRNRIHPTLNVTHPDPKCDLDYVPNHERQVLVQAALSNSFGFGGQNASIIVKKPVAGYS